MGHNPSRGGPPHPRTPEEHRGLPGISGPEGQPPSLPGSVSPPDHCHGVANVPQAIISIGFCAPSRLPNGSDRGAGLPQELGINGAILVIIAMWGTVRPSPVG
jgi:hypothetical protein